jgi:tRNA nucleotidyltransferase (CCA-adding enzyme)
MKDIHLQGTPGQAQDASVVQEVIQASGVVFPESIAAYDITGSYADQTYLSTSDIDRFIRFCISRMPGTKARSLHLKNWQQWSLSGPRIGTWKMAL